jgi:hypothetical protein
VIVHLLNYHVVACILSSKLWSTHDEWWMEGRSIKLMSMGGLTVKILKILHEVWVKYPTDKFQLPITLEFVSIIRSLARSNFSLLAPWETFKSIYVHISKDIGYLFKSIDLYLKYQILPFVLFMHARDLLALPPLVDVGLRWFTLKFNFNPEGKVKY